MTKMPLPKMLQLVFFFFYLTQTAISANETFFFGRRKKLISFTFFTQVFKYKEFFFLYIFSLTRGSLKENISMKTKTFKFKALYIKYQEPHRAEKTFTLKNVFIL